MKTLLLILVTTGLLGCATPQMRTPQTIDVVVTVHLYESEKALNEAYTKRGGIYVWGTTLKRLRGFYDGSIYCVKWDFERCGHELFHALQNTGELKTDGRDHFETN